jgi:hypothetical protein
MNRPRQRPRCRGLFISIRRTRNRTSLEHHRCRRAARQLGHTLDTSAIVHRELDRFASADRVLREARDCSRSASNNLSARTNFSRRGSLRPLSMTESAARFRTTSRFCASFALSLGCCSPMCLVPAPAPRPTSTGARNCGAFCGPYHSRWLSRRDMSRFAQRTRASHGSS